MQKKKSNFFCVSFELFNFILVFLWWIQPIIFSHWFYEIRVVVRHRKYIAHDIHSWAFFYLIANTLKSLYRKVSCCPWNHTWCQIQGTYAMTKPPYCAVSNATPMQTRKFNVLSSFIIILFMIKPAHTQEGCAPRQALILLVEKLHCGVEKRNVHTFAKLITGKKN